VLSNVTRVDSGPYTALVTNAAGSTLSSNALVRVRVAQRLSQPVPMADGSFLIYSGDVDGSWLTTGDTENLEAYASTNLVDWSPLPATATLTNGQLRLHDTESTNYPMRFYQVIEH